MLYKIALWFLMMSYAAMIIYVIATFKWRPR